MTLPLGFLDAADSEYWPRQRDLRILRAWLAANGVRAKSFRRLEVRMVGSLVLCVDIGSGEPTDLLVKSLPPVQFRGVL